MGRSHIGEQMGSMKAAKPMKAMKAMKSRIHLYIYIEGERERASRLEINGEATPPSLAA